MLILTRRIAERIVVPDCNLTLTILGVDGNKIRLGITAPVDVKVFREEVWQQIVERDSKGAPVDPSSRNGQDSGRSDGFRRQKRGSGS